MYSSHCTIAGSAAFRKIGKEERIGNLTMANMTKRRQMAASWRMDVHINPPLLTIIVFKISVETLLNPFHLKDLHFDPSGLNGRRVQFRTPPANNDKAPHVPQDSSQPH